MEKYEDEEIPLLDLEATLDSEDAKSYFEAFKQFDHKNTGHISNRVPAKQNDNCFTILYTYFISGVASCSEKMVGLSQIIGKDLI